VGLDAVSILSDPTGYLMLQRIHGVGDSCDGYPMGTTLMCVVQYVRRGTRAASHIPPVGVPSISDAWGTKHLGCLEHPLVPLEGDAWGAAPWYE